MEWNIEELKLLNEESRNYGRTRIFNCENKVTREEKIAFVDKFQDGKLSYLLELIEKFNKDKEELPKDCYGVKTVSLKSWIKRNDIKYDRPIIDNRFNYGEYRLLGIQRKIQYDYKQPYDTYEDLVDELFHRQLEECLEQEKQWFLEHDEFSILKSELIEKMEKYHTTFGVKIAYGSQGITIYNPKVDFYKESRDITIEEVKELLEKYSQLENLINKLTEETHIKY